MVTVLGILGILKPFVSYSKNVALRIKAFSTAREDTDRQRVELQRAESDLKFWEILVPRICTSLKDGTLKKGLQDDLDDLVGSANELREEIRTWCRRLSLDFPGEILSTEEHMEIIANEPNPQEVNDTLLQESTTQTNVPARKSLNRRHLKNHKMEGQGKSASIPGRTRFILHGKSRIQRNLEQFDEAQNKLSVKCAALAPFAATMQLPNTEDIRTQSGTTAVMRFILAAKERVEKESPINRLESFANEDGNIVSAYRYSSRIHIDEKMASSGMRDYDIMYGSLEPCEGLRGGSTPPYYSDCIIVPRGGTQDWDLIIDQASTIYRIFAEDSPRRSYFTDPPDGDMLRSCAMLVDSGAGTCDLLFRIPNNTRPNTLRQLLLDERSTPCPLHPLADRVKLALRLATEVLVVHSVGIVHKRINPECIVVLEPLPMNKKQVFPYRLGFPYIAAFQAARTDIGFSYKASEKEAYRRRGIYYHPRDQGETRRDIFLMLDDIYSLGICLFEIALWRSLFVWNDEVKDYVHDDTFVPLSNAIAELQDLNSLELATAKTGRVLEAAKTMIPAVLGQEFADVVVACISAGYDNGPFSDELEMKKRHSTGNVSLIFLELVLDKLQDIHRKLAN